MVFQIFTFSGATILKLLEVEHPAAKVLVELSQIQDREVVLKHFINFLGWRWYYFCCRFGCWTFKSKYFLLKFQRGNQLIQNKIHPTTVISGFRTALKESVKFILGNMTIKMQDLTDDILKKTAITTLSSKLIGP